MTECKVNEYYVENKQIFDLISVSQAYLKTYFKKKSKVLLLKNQINQYLYL